MVLSVLDMFQQGPLAEARVIGGDLTNLSE